MSDNEDNRCPYSVVIAGVSICMLNVQPCERVSLKLCERVPVRQSGVAGESEVFNEYVRC